MEGCQEREVRGNKEQFSSSSHPGACKITHTSCVDLLLNNPSFCSGPHPPQQWFLAQHSRYLCFQPQVGNTGTIRKQHSFNFQNTDESSDKFTPASKPTLTPTGADENYTRNNNELFLLNPHFMFLLHDCLNARDSWWHWEWCRALQSSFLIFMSFAWQGK